MRALYIVAYDVSDPKRLHNLHKRMLGFGEPLQYSVFMCLLSPKERILMMDAIEKEMKKTEDRVIVIDIGPEGKRTEERITFIGTKGEIPTRDAIII